MRAWVRVMAVVALGAAGSAGDTARAQAPVPVRPQALMAHLRFLADDLLEGRGTGTRGFDLAALYAAAHFEALGLLPAGVGGSWLQPVPLRSGSLEPGKTSASWTRGREHVRLTYETDYIAVPNLHREESEVEAGVVFVGYGVQAPELGHDDYAPVSVEGRIVAFLFGAPPGFPGDQRAHHGAMSNKIALAARHGAVGMLLVRPRAAEEFVPWKRVVENARLPVMRWLDEQGRPSDAPATMRAGLALSVEASARLFGAVDRDLEALAASAQEGRRVSFELPGVRLQARTVSRHAELRSPNVAALLRGSDPRLARETLVFSAHLDHLGLGEPREGDGIWNGAYDNASGVAGLLELARVFALSPAPRRSVLFLLVTGEERGLLGSDYFARHPTQAEVVANVNLDMITMFGPFTDVIAYGAEHSSLGETARRAAESVGLTLSPDPWPEQTLFVRSDHYSFVRQGVPSIYLFPGLRRADPEYDGKAEALAWARRFYHSPKDDLSQPFDARAGARLVEVAYALGRLVADDDARPAWNAGDFFGETFGARAGPGAER